jgi:hypothetical protein
MKKISKIRISTGYAEITNVPLPGILIISKKYWTTKTKTPNNKPKTPPTKDCKKPMSK